MILEAIKDDLNDWLPPHWEAQWTPHSQDTSPKRVLVIQRLNSISRIRIFLDGATLGTDEIHERGADAQLGGSRKFDLTDPVSIDDFSSYVDQIVNEQ